MSDPLASTGASAPIGQLAPVGPISGRARQRGSSDSPQPEALLDTGAIADAFEPSARLLAVLATISELADPAATLAAELSPPATPLAADDQHPPGAALAMPLLAPLPTAADVDRAAGALRAAAQVAAQARGLPPAPAPPFLLPLSLPSPSASTSGSGRAVAEIVAAPPPPSTNPAALAILGQAWNGQSLQMTIEPDEQRGPYRDDRERQAVWGARIRLELPRLGVVEIALRVAGHSIAVELRGDHPAAFDAALSELSSGLAAHGLDPVSLAAMPLQAPQ